MDNGQPILDRLTTLLNTAMFLYMKNDIMYKGTFRGMGKKKKLVFDLTEKLTKVGVENCRPIYEKTAMHSTEYINPEDLVNFEVDQKTFTEANLEVSRPSQDEVKKVPVAHAQHPPGKTVPPRNCIPQGWVYQPATWNGQVVFIPQLYSNISYVYCPPIDPVRHLKPTFHVNIQPIHVGVPNIVQPQSEPPIRIDNKVLHDHEFEIRSQNRNEQQPNYSNEKSSHLSNKNPCNLINQATNCQDLDVSPTILQNYSIAQLMAGVVPGAENLFQKKVPNLQEQSEEEFQFEPTVGVFPVRRPKQTVNQDKNEINPIKINSSPIECMPGEITNCTNTQDKIQLEKTCSGSRTKKPDARKVDYLSVPYALINANKMKNTGKGRYPNHFNNDLNSGEIKYTILKREKHKPCPAVPSPEVFPRSPDETDFDKMSSEEFESHMTKSLGVELMNLINVSSNHPDEKALN